MPQPVSKAIFRDVLGRLDPKSLELPLCEWGLYFNAAPALDPDRFAEPEPYVTLGWPENPASWQATVEPAAFMFENYFGEHYEHGAVYDGIDPGDTSMEAAVEKAVRWRRYELEVLKGDRDPIIGSPPPVPPLKEALRKARAVAVGDPIRHERQQRALLAAMLRAVRRRSS